MTIYRERVIKIMKLLGNTYGYLWLLTSQFLLVLSGFLSFYTFAEESYSPHIDQTYPQNVFWGDTHLHTNLSVDAFGYGNKNLGPEEAYRFAKGQTITAHNGLQARLNRPLDFLVIADHAENMGVMQAIEAKNAELLATEPGQRWYKTFKAVQSTPGKKGFDFVDKRSKDMIYEQLSTVVDSDTFKSSVWAEVTAIADAHNNPGNFTALIGYEWTGPSHIHRVIVFKDSAEKVIQQFPFSNLDSDRPEDLWAHLSRYEQDTGGEALAIPHNGNLTTGNMFKLEDSGGNNFSQSYAQTRARWEPLVEVTQTKGDSETHPFLSPGDEFADYETWEYDPTKAIKSLFQYEYARSALKLGLAQQDQLGVNPFKFGMIGSTDAHTSMSGVEEDNFWGILSAGEPKPERAKGSIIPEFWTEGGEKVSASGYAAIWAEENTREALFSAMKRKEVYATTGPRITVRFFAGWDYRTGDAFDPDFAKIGYSKGVPMGGDLASAPNGKSPRFLIRAIKDPDGANLDRVQVIKGWHDKKGELYEKVYNVALSDGRKEDKGGKVPPVGSTVDVKNAAYTNSIGDPELAVVWTDPDFDKDELAFYYVRVLEIPTPRWTAYDAKFFGLKDLLHEIPMVTQERAYTSPIWYTP